MVAGGAGYQPSAEVLEQSYEKKPAFDLGGVKVLGTPLNQ